MKNTDVQLALQGVLQRILTTHEVTEPELRAFIYHRAIEQKAFLGSETVDLTKVYNNVSDGDIAYAVFRVFGIYEKEVYFSFRDDAALFVNGEMLWDGSGTGEFRFFDIKASPECSTEVMIRCVCKEGRFGFEYAITTPEYKHMWPKDYHYCARRFFPVEEFANEEGIAFSKKFSVKDSEGAEQFEKERREYVFPPKISNCTAKDFNLLYGGEKGDIAYAVSYAKQATELAIQADSSLSIFVNNRKTGTAGAGQTVTVKLALGDEVLVKARREGAWGFSCSDDGLYIPNLSSRRRHGDKWLLLGSFESAGNMDKPFAPEREIQFHRPYVNSCKKKIFFRFADGISYLRPYQDSVFFGQWYYAVMCGHYGLLKVAQAFDDSRCYDYFANSMRLLARYFEYAAYDRAMFNADPPVLLRSVCLDNLDNIGTIGLNAAEAYFITNDSTLKALAVTLAEALNDVPRFSNGVYHRCTTMWSDDLFMACPFLLRMWQMTGNGRYIDTAATQLLEYTRLMYMKDQNVFSHIYFVDKNKPSRVPWGRGNGWVMVSLAEFLELVPHSHKDYAEIEKIFLQMSRGIVGLQDVSGLWHEVLNQPESYLETSCTLMFLYAFSKGLDIGVLDVSYQEAADRAWLGICEHALDESGNLYGICGGSGCSDQWEYYDALKTITNDEHGTGIFLAAVCEYYKLINNKKGEKI